MSTNPREATRPAIPWRNRSPCHPQQWMPGSPPPHTAIWPPFLHTRNVFISYYSEFSIQQHHWFPQKLWLRWICQYTEFHRNKDRIHLYVFTSSSIELYIILCLKLNKIAYMTLYLNLGHFHVWKKKCMFWPIGKQCWCDVGFFYIGAYMFGYTYRSWVCQSTL